MTSPLPRLHERRALVTGAGSGIGEETAVRFAREGAKVGLVGRTVAKLEAVARRIRADGGECLVLPADVSDEPAIEAAVAGIVAAWGGLDACVAVAGIEMWNEGDDRVDRLELAVWRRIIDVNLTGMFLTCKHAIRAMLATGGGSLIVTGSPTGMYGLALGEDAYSASKAGCHGLARVMANEYAEAGHTGEHRRARLHRHPDQREGLCRSQGGRGALRPDPHGAPGPARRSGGHERLAGLG